MTRANLPAAPAKLTLTFTVLIGMATPPLAGGQVSHLEVFPLPAEWASVTIAKSNFYCTAAVGTLAVGNQYVPMRWRLAGGVEAVTAGIPTGSNLRAISADGSVVVGTTSDSRPFRTDLSDLQYLAVPANFGTALAVSNDGQIVVGSCYRGGELGWGACMWDGAGFTPLTISGCSATYDITGATGISGNGQCIGAWSERGCQGGAVWSTVRLCDGQAQTLSSATCIGGVAISEDGNAILGGAVQDCGGSRGSTLWTPTSGTQSLNARMGGDWFMDWEGSAASVANGGVVALGTHFYPGRGEPPIWDAAGGSRRFSAVLHALQPSTAEWGVVRASGLSSDGKTVLGTAVRSDGRGVVWRVTIEQLPWPGFCPADTNFSGAVTVQDIFDFLASYFDSNRAVYNGDFNKDGTNSVQDLFDFLAAYFANCQ